jgi:hypothetical protein
MIAKVQMMKSVVGIEMTTYRVRMKCNENNIVEAFWNKLKMSVGGTALNRLAENEHFIFDHNE